MTATARAVELAQAAAAAATNKLAEEVVALDVTEHLALTDVFVIASAPTVRQVMAVVEAVEDRLSAAGAKVLRREGQGEGRWVLLDFGDVVVHIMHGEDREYYDLERLWKDCPELELEQPTPVEPVETPDA